jgi:hypothetical protein
MPPFQFVESGHCRFDPECSMAAKNPIFLCCRTNLENIVRLTCKEEVKINGGRLRD